MSEKLLQLVWRNFPEGGSRLQVLQAVAEAANEQGNCYPSLAHLAVAARMSRSSAWRALKRLRRERWIVTDRILGRGGVLILQINVPKLGRSCREDEDHSTPTRVRPGGTL
jgi:CTP-dependent riboflavin kinase